MLERMMIFNKFALTVLRLLSPKYIGIREHRNPIHVVEYRKCFTKNPFSGKEYEDFQITYLTQDGRFFTLSEKVFYKFYGREV